jgi:hypothetical protein
MKDALMLLLIVAFFALCIAYVAWCDRIIGPDPAEPGVTGTADAGANDANGESDGQRERVPGNVSAS